MDRLWSQPAKCYRMVRNWFVFIPYHIDMLHPDRVPDKGNISLPVKCQHVARPQGIVVLLLLNSGGSHPSLTPKEKKKVVGGEGVGRPSFILSPAKVSIILLSIWRAEDR